MKKLVLSGSMKFLKEMKTLQTMLQKSGYRVVIPKADNWEEIPPEQIHEHKRAVSKRYFDEIAAADTDGILVVNLPKNGCENYIGANSFAEIALAFYFEKKIFLLHQIYPPYADELLGWGAVALKGNLGNMK